MESSQAIELGRESMRIVIMLGGPILLIGLILGLVVGMLQSMTQVHDQTVGFVPKVIGLILAIGVGLPWLSEQMIDYSRELLARPAFPLAPHGNRTRPDSATISIHASSVPIDNRSIANGSLIPTPDLRDSDESGSGSDQLSGEISNQELLRARDHTDDRGSNPFQLPRHRFSRLPKADQEL